MPLYTVTFLPCVQGETCYRTMSYTPVWTNSNAQGRLDAGDHFVKLLDAQELAAAVNRRRLLTYQLQQDFSSQIAVGAYVRKSAISSASAPPFDNLRDNLSQSILDPPTGSVGGVPPTPSAMRWLWPVADADENKTIVSGYSGVGEGEVGLLAKLNGTSDWTDATLTPGVTDIRTVHFNELRQAAEWISRGSWELPIYFSAGIFSAMPDTPWMGEAIGNNGTHELRSVGNAIITVGPSPLYGPTNVTVRSSSSIELTVDVDCSVEVYRCHRPILFASDPPTWNEYDPSEETAWAQAGGLGSGDTTLIGSMDLQADQPDSLSGDDLATALGAMVDGAQQNFLVRRTDTSSATIALAGAVTIEFDLDTPPN